jgi:hypothetical protein
MAGMCWKHVLTGIGKLGLSPVDRARLRVRASDDEDDPLLNLLLRKRPDRNQVQRRPETD